MSGSFGGILTSEKSQTLFQNQVTQIIHQISDNLQASRFAAFQFDCLSVWLTPTEVFLKDGCCKLQPNMWNVALKASTSFLPKSRFVNKPLINTWVYICLTFLNCYVIHPQHVSFNKNCSCAQSFRKNKTKTVWVIFQLSAGRKKKDTRLCSSFFLFCFVIRTMNSTTHTRLRLNLQ